MTMNFLEMASEMLGASLPSTLEKRLIRVDALAMEIGGGLFSRQVIAMIIEQWERENA